MHDSFAVPGLRGMLAADADMNVVHMHERRLGFMATMGNIGRRGLLGSAVAVAAAAATGLIDSGTASATSRPAATGTATATGRASAAGGPRATPLWRELAAAPFTHPQVPFIGRAGYRGGCDLPRRTGRGVVARLQRDGAKPDNTAPPPPPLKPALAPARERGGGPGVK
ncbi:hypothetical protein ACFU9V_21315, partial [Streptomyces sp. NPDC057557]